MTTHEMLLFIFVITTGIALLAWSADQFVTGATSLAANFRVPPMVIGLTIVAFGTSSPELLVSATAAWQGNSNLGIGNVVGSNIANMALVLGTAALIAPLTVNSQTLRREFPLMLLAMFIAMTLIWNGELTRLDGLILLTGMLVLLVWTIYLAREMPISDTLAIEYDTEIPITLSINRSVTRFLAGMLLMLLSSHLLVWAAVGIAHAFGVSDLIVGLTIVAVGTSLPELAATTMAVRKGAHDIAVGGVVGSNLFNTLAVLGIVGLLGPGAFEAVVMTRDYPLMMALAFFLYLMAGGAYHSRHGSISRLTGGALVAVFVSYQLWVILDTTLIAL